MREVFTANIPNIKQGKQMVKSLKEHNLQLEIDFDIENPVVNYPFQS